MFVRPTWSGRATAVTVPPRTARRNCVVDDVVLVVAPVGRFSTAHTAPTLSASAMIAPPWSTPPPVVRSGCQSNSPVTSSLSAGDEADAQGGGERHDVSEVRDIAHDRDAAWCGVRPAIRSGRARFQ
jgi:hypothetical protein